MGKSTIFDVAKKAGVSKSTVSRVINNQGNVKEKTRKKILKVMRSLNYHPNSSARSLVTKRTNTIGLIVPDITDFFYLQFIKGAEVVGIKNNYNMMLLSSRWDVEEERYCLKMFGEGRVDGVLLISGNWVGEPYLNCPELEKMPLVIIDRTLNNHVIPTINVDNKNGGYLGTRHLLENGHRMIAFVTGLANQKASLDRMEGYRQAMDEAGVRESDNLIYPGDFTEKSGYQVTRQVLEAGKGITAIFYANDLMAIGGIKAIKEKGLKIPDDLSLIGCDDLELVSLIDPPFTTLRQPRYKMGYTGMELLINSIEHKDNINPAQIIYHMALIQRNSVQSRS